MRSERLAFARLKKQWLKADTEKSITASFEQYTNYVDKMCYIAPKSLEKCDL